MFYLIRILSNSYVSGLYYSLNDELRLKEPLSNKTLNQISTFNSFNFSFDFDDDNHLDDGGIVLVSSDIETLTSVYETLSGNPFKFQKIENNKILEGDYIIGINEDIPDTHSARIIIDIIGNSLSTRL